MKMEELWWIRNRSPRQSLRQELQPGLKCLLPKGAPTPSHSGVKSLSAVLILAHAHLEVLPGDYNPECQDESTPTKRIQHGAAFLLNILDPFILPPQARNVISTWPRDNRFLLQRWSKEPSLHWLPANSPEPFSPKRSATLKLQEWLVEWSKCLELSLDRTSALTDQTAVPGEES